MNRPRLWKLALVLLSGASVVGACSVDDAPMEAASCMGLNCSGQLGPPADAQNVPGTLSDAPDAASAPPPPVAKEACGVGMCLPGDLEACRDHSEPPVPPPDAGVGLDAGAALGDAGPSDASVEGPEIDGSFAQPERRPPDTPLFACQVSLTERGGVERGCGAAGSQQAEQPCTSSLDCAPGLGCVGSVRAGRCLPYCCGVGADTCERGFYCAERPLRSDALGEENGPLVPVCDRADNCSLGEQEDCTGPRCLCGAEMACALVRPDGTTSCVPLAESPGQAGEPCPCDRGYHCSQATKPASCVKMCDLDEKDAETCGAGVCQASEVLPAGWGICVFAAPEQMPSP